MSLTLTLTLPSFRRWVVFFLIVVLIHIDFLLVSSIQISLIVSYIFLIQILRGSAAAGRLCDRREQRGDDLFRIINLSSREILMSICLSLRACVIELVWSFHFTSLDDLN